MTTQCLPSTFPKVLTIGIADDVGFRIGFPQNPVTPRRHIGPDLGQEGQCGQCCELGVSAWVPPRADKTPLLFCSWTQHPPSSLDSQNSQHHPKGLREATDTEVNCRDPIFGIPSPDSLQPEGGFPQSVVSTHPRWLLLVPSICVPGAPLIAVGGWERYLLLT